MRVLFVSDYPHLPDLKGGLQTSTHDLSLAIATAGGEAAVLCGLNEDGVSAEAAARPSMAATTASTTATHRDERLGYLCVRAASPEQALAQLADEWQPSAIVVQSGNALLPLVLASLRSGRPTAVYLHNVEVHQLRGTLIPDPSLLYLANSPFTAQRWRALCGLHCEVIPPVVRPEAYLAAHEANTSGGGDQILFVNPTPIKGVQRLFELAAACPALPFLVVESWQLEPHWRQLCQYRAQQLGNVRWLPPTDDMRSVYAQSRLLLMPSVWEESFGRTVIEAQLNGLPVLASNRGALPQVVGAGGLTLDPHDSVPAWTEALRRLLREHASFSASARAQALQHAAATPLIVGQLLGLLAQHAAR